MADKPFALIVEDTEANRTFFERLIQQAGFQVKGVSSGTAALAEAENASSLALAVIDMQMPDISGLELTMRLRRMHPQACLIVATMYDDISLVSSAFLKGCNIYLVKPHGFMELFKRLTTLGSAGIVAEGPVIIDQYGPRPFKGIPG